MNVLMNYYQTLATRITTRLERSSRRRIHRAAGLSFIELMLALAATALIGTSVMSMLVATSYGTTTNKEMLGVLVKQKTIASRLDAAIRSSKMVLESGYNASADVDYLVLWMADTRENEKPNLSELRLVQYSRATDSLNFNIASFPLGLSDVALELLDLEFELTDDFWTVLQTAIGGLNFPGVTWGGDITAVTFTLDNVDPQAARLVSYRLTLADGDVSDTVIGTVSLRNE